jgi:Glycosyl hydrolases family 2/Glycosyl hydrolases family 2, sugar binding domain/Glycosyl hydrolases family 2, TIM barrel domain
MLLRAIVVFAWATAAVGSVRAQAPAANWQPANGPLMTRWARDVSPDRVLPEYPRPQLVRDEWLNLNGLWDYAIRPRGEARPAKWDGQILVPFAVESALSGVMKPVGPDNRLWYRRTFAPRAAWRGKRLLLHFGAVDWHAEVFVNGTRVGEHRGGYDPFTFDITGAIGDRREHELVVSVWDPTDAGKQPRGKQVRKPRSIWYTAVTGIWQTVWVEPVATRYVERLRITPDVAGSQVRVDVAVAGPSGASLVDVVIKDADGRSVVERRGVQGGTPIELALPKARLWSPAAPHLYDLEVTLREGKAVIDRVGSYFGMRSLEMRKDRAGVNRLFLNGAPVFQLGPLDQGWWPDGLYTAPMDAALKYDIEVTRQLGFNMARKHVKVEPARWYYWCDTLGLLVWQDMPSGDYDTAESQAQYRRELESMMDALANHPSIVMWVPFNEGWGQFDTESVAKLVKARDPSRLVNEASGWDDRGSGDVRDIHQYPGPSIPPLEDDRAAVLGEFGGLGFVVDDHLWQRDENWGYRSYKSRTELNDQYAGRLSALGPLIAQGLVAAVYTQTTDVEIEVNGLMTYDRAVVKLDADRVRKLHETLYQPPPAIETLLPSSAASPHAWHYATTTPAANWFESAFDASGWPRANAPFGNDKARVARPATAWTTSEIWARRTFSVSRIPDGRLYLSLAHDEDAVVYVNGRKVAEVGSSSSGYEAIDASDALRAALRTGENVIAVHCRQTKGDQFIDVGLFTLESSP